MNEKLFIRLKAFVYQIDENDIRIFAVTMCTGSSYWHFPVITALPETQILQTVATDIFQW